MMIMINIFVGQNFIINIIILIKYILKINKNKIIINKFLIYFLVVVCVLFFSLPFF